jgi:hypothetical protein
LTAAALVERAVDGSPVAECVATQAWRAVDGPAVVRDGLAFRPAGRSVRKQAPQFREATPERQY